MHAAKIQKKSKPAKKFTEKFGSMKKIAYLCTVKMQILTIR